MPVAQTRGLPFLRFRSRWRGPEPPRLRQMVSELHSTPYAGHADVLKRFESEIVEKAQHQGQSSTERFETLEFVQVGLPRGSTWSLPTGFDYDRVCRESP
jgi:hypothetical protein